MTPLPISSWHNFFTFLYHTILLGIERYHPKSLCYRGGTFENRILPEAEVHANNLDPFCQQKFLLNFCLIIFGKRHGYASQMGKCRFLRYYLAFSPKYENIISQKIEMLSHMTTQEIGIDNILYVQVLPSAGVRFPGHLFLLCLFLLLILCFYFDLAHSFDFDFR